MEFNEAAMISGIHQNDRKKIFSTRCLTADIVMIDRSHAFLNPLLYQIRQEALKHTEWELFTMLGEVLSIDRVKKQIYLANDTYVSYRHLIMASGLDIHERMQHLAEGLHALLAAMRVRKNASSYFVDKSADGFQRKQSLQLSQGNSKNSSQEVKKFFALQPTLGISITSGLTLPHSTRLYEVQLSGDNIQ